MGRATAPFSHIMNETKRLVYSKQFSPIPTMVRRQNVLSYELCDKIIRLQRKKGLVPGVVWDGKQFVQDKEYRVVDTADILEEDVPELYTILNELVLELNENAFKFNIYGVFDDAIFMEYRAANVNQGDGFFNWHVDAGDSYTSLRKFSIVIGLNNPEEYDGGDLVIQNGGMEHNVRLRKGDIAAFPAYINHCVTPVTRGVRNSIVVFIVGPRFV